MANPLTLQNFIHRARKIHGRKYDYSNVEYKNNYTPVSIECPIHGKFLQIPKNHLTGVECRRCYRTSVTYSKSKFIQDATKIHGNLYDYSRCQYKNSSDKVEIVCKKHGAFWVKPNNHTINKSGCPKCKWSIGELKIFNYLTEHNISHERNKTFPKCISPAGWPLKYDFFIPSKNLLIEYDGKQHFSESKIGYYTTNKTDLTYTRKKDRIKTRFAADNGIKLLRIPYWKEYKLEKILEKNI